MNVIEEDLEGKTLQLFSFLHTKGSLEGEINTSTIIYDDNVAEEVKIKFCSLIEGNNFFSLSPSNKNSNSNMFAVRKHAEIRYLDLCSA